MTGLGNDRPLFSVVVLLYNQAQLVEEALESVFEQGYGPVELLVCDDASADGSADVAERWCREHALRFSRWEVLRQPGNRGILPNQLNGIRESRGEYIKTLAADDLLLPGALEAAAEFFGREPGVGLACGGVRAFPAAEGKRGLGWKWPGEADLPFFSLGPGLQYRRLVSGQTGILAPSVFASRKVYENIDLASLGIRLVNDYPAWLLATLAGFRFGFIGRDTSLYRLSPASISQHTARQDTRVRRRWRADVVRINRSIILPNVGKLGFAERYHARYKALQAENRLFNGARPFRRFTSNACLLAMSIFDTVKWKALFRSFSS